MNATARNLAVDETSLLGRLSELGFPVELHPGTTQDDLAWGAFGPENIGVLGAGETRLDALLAAVDFVERAHAAESGLACHVPWERMIYKVTAPICGTWLRYFDCPVCHSTLTREIQVDALDADAVVGAVDWWLGERSLRRMVLTCDADTPARECTLFDGAKLRGFGRDEDPAVAMRLALEAAT